MIEMKETREGEVLVLHLTGELMGGDESAAFQKRVYKAIQDEEVNVVADMEGVKWMNSSGLGMLMGALTTLRSSGGDLRLARVPERVRRPIVVTKLDGVLSLHPTVQAAVDSFAEGG